MGPGKLMENSNENMLKRLFPDSVVTVTCHPLKVSADMVLAEERAVIQHARSRRQREFLAGRWAAGHALAQLGCPRRPLLPGVDRAPQWPSGFVGSISHADGCCGAAVAHTQDIRSLGLDIEQRKAVDKTCYAQLFTPKERQAIQIQAPSQQRTYATLLFSAKECLYKCQYPLSGQWLGFHDVVVDIDPQAHTFTATLQIDSNTCIPKDTPVTGRYRLTPDYALTGMVLLPDTV